ncbi:unnamed protein product [Rotaria sp. Silwood1]|nr:unnamed protein product [Rotaria sp. Silwood1]CAF0745470.1 unnamed protein product [Rotaria sp. Silwood1]CAF3360660.1 unnamed protein product [Rotaria sp. Silwood1]CAF4585892.1 unnamed protein product [Rotaria sp. Silwood1]CAF4665500.1 unnamed protein product [Rotaria sp. Silwood1]
MYLLSQINQLLLFVTILCNTTFYECDKINDDDTMQYSWSIIVSLRYDCQRKNNPITHCCSGTILTDSYILTAADCVGNFSENMSLDDVTIAAGIYHRSELGQIIRNVDEIIIHPNWKTDNNGQKHNIALLHLSTPLDFTVDKYITQIFRSIDFSLLKDILQYPSNSTRLLTIELDRVTQHFDSTASVSLQQYEVSLVDNYDPICYGLVYDVEQQFCTRLYHHNKDSCNHKSGGPILQWIDNRWMQVGIRSSVGEGINGSCLDIVTRLAYYHEWIDSVLNLKSFTSLTIATKSDSIANVSITYKCNALMVSCGCGRNNVELSPTKIIGGEEAIPYSWSMVVSIRVNDSQEHSCAGSILTQSYILTSAHCVDGASKLEVSIAAGMHNQIEDFAMIRYVHDIYIHPNWNGSDSTYRNDIALLRISPPLFIPGNLGLARTCVPHINSINETVNYPTNGSHLVIVGWGSTQYGYNNMSNTLQQASVYVIDNNDHICQQWIHDGEKQFCAGMYGKDPCYGDSGGPIFQWKGTYWEQVGIISYGRGCHQIGSLAIFTRLAYYFDWMESVINISLTTTTPKPPPTPISYACNKTSSCGCGKADVVLTSSRIVGGENAIEGSWPMIVSLRLNGTNDHSCGGTILSNSYILTAAHCFRRISIENPTGITIAAGMTNRSDPLKVIRNVDRIYLHPNYTGIPNDYRHDIALLHIEHPFVFETNSSLTKTCIHRIDPPISQTQYPKNATRLAIIGWGVLLHGTLYVPEILQQAQVFAIDDQNPICSSSINNTELEFCAGLFDGGKDSCQGDSGGPIFQWTGLYWEQVGIVSHGKGCALANSPVSINKTIRSK